MDEQDLIYDWNSADTAAFDWGSVADIELDDETLRDGLQNPSVVDPPIEAKIRLLHLMDELGIHTADIGLPGAGPRAVEAVEALAREIVEADLSIEANCAARTVVADVRPIAEISQSVGLAIEACTFIGSSPIRQYAEDWTLDKMLHVSEEAVTFAVAEGLPVMFVTEDTVRARPETLRALYGRAIEWGARRLCVADTVGHATPDGARALVRFVVEEIVGPSGEDVGVDWHGHRDRGLGLANALAAIEAGATRIHGTALGIGERVGNVEMDLLLVNLKLLGLHDADLTRLPEYCRVAAEACQVPLTSSYPVVGRDAFWSTRGCHREGCSQRGRVAGRPHLLGCARLYGGEGAGDRDRAHVRTLERQGLADGPRVRPRRRRRLPHTLRRRQGHGPHADRSRDPSASRAELTGALGRAFRCGRRGSIPTIP